VISLAAAWAWLKKYWEALTGLLLLAIGVVVGVTIRKRPVSITGADPDKKKIEDQTSAKGRQADQVAEVKKVQAVADHAAEVKVTIDAVEQKTEQVRDNPQAVNDYLHQVGDDARKE